MWAEKIQFTFLGYDCVLYVGKQTMQYGNKFPYFLNKEQQPVLHTKFYFNPVYRSTPDDSGNNVSKYENSYVNILKFQNNSFRLDEWRVDVAAFSLVNEPFTEGNESFTEGNESFTEGNKSFTEGNRSFTEGNEPFTKEINHLPKEMNHLQVKKPPILRG